MLNYDDLRFEKRSRPVGMCIALIIMGKLILGIEDMTSGICTTGSIQDR